MNRAKCLNCNDIVESKHRHDWQCCSCFDETQTLVVKLSEKLAKANSEHAIQCILQEELGHGFFLDGGGEYCRCGGNIADIQWLNEDNNG